MVILCFFSCGRQLGEFSFSYWRERERSYLINGRRVIRRKRSLHAIYTTVNTYSRSFFVVLFVWRMRREHLYVIHQFEDPSRWPEMLSESKALARRGRGTRSRWHNSLFDGRCGGSLPIIVFGSIVMTLGAAVVCLAILVGLTSRSPPASVAGGRRASRMCVPIPSGPGC